MKRFSLLVTSAVIAGLTAAPALAVDAKGGANMNTGAQVDTDSSTTASTSSDANFGMLISSLNAGARSAAEIKAMTDVSSVSVVKIEDLQRGSNAAAVKNAISRNAEARADLQAAIDANADIKAQLDEQSVEISSVVAAQVGAGGTLTVFVQ